MDWSIFQAVNRFARRTGWLHGVMRFFADNGIVLFAVLLAVAGVVALRRSDTRLLGGTVWAAVAALIVLVLNQPIANWVDRARPYRTHPTILTLVDRGNDPSFMSDHSVVAAAVAVGLLLVARRLGMVAVLAALVMAFTRVYVGAHYPGDVLAGLAFGTIVTLAGAQLARRLLDPLAHRLLAWRPVRAIASPNN